MQPLTAGSFYDFRIVLIPHNLPAATLSSHLQNSKADALIAEAGSVDLSLVTKGNKQVSVVIWVAKYGNRHMDWHEVPKDVKGTLEVSVWHELAEEGKDLAGFDVPEYDPTTPAPAVHTIWPSDSQSGEFIDFKQEVRDLPEKQSPFGHVAAIRSPKPCASIELGSIYAPFPSRQGIWVFQALATMVFQMRGSCHSGKV